MRLAKPCLDVGLYTDQYEALRAFWGDRVGLHYEELLKAGRGIHQHRFGLRGSVLKVNDSRDHLDDAPTAFMRVDIAADRFETLRDPDGTEVVLTPDVEAITVHWRSSDPDRLGELLRSGFDAVDRGERRWQIGTTMLALHPGGGPVGPLRARGFRYLTVQVFDVRVEHANLLSRGWTEGTAPIKLGETAYISFVLDPDGAPVEVSQRASLTGKLPDV